MYTLLGAYLVASTTAGTLLIINYSKVVYNLNCSLGAGLLTLHTADTTVGACLVGYSALIIAGALNNHTGLLAYYMNNAVRTGLSAKTAAYALSRINVCDAVFGIDGNSILGANRDTVAISETSVGTYGIARVRKLCSLTGLNSIVNVLSVLGLAVTVTSNVGDLSVNVASSKTNDLTDLSRNVSATGDTKAGIIALALTESLSITVTARVTASAAVCAGKAITNRNDLLVFLNRKEACGKGKNNSTYKSNQRKNA